MGDGPRVLPPPPVPTPGDALRAGTYTWRRPEGRYLHLETPRAGGSWSDTVRYLKTRPSLKSPSPSANTGATDRWKTGVKIMILN